jgi:predicted enzyme related to lactoylglutathione lyase
MLSGGVAYSFIQYLITSTTNEDRTMINPMKQHGAFSWNELMTSDVAGAKSFYGEMFSWKFEDSNGDIPYTMAKIDEQDSAGLMTMPPEAGGMPPMWGGYVTVDDVDASAKQAVALGGKILLDVRDIPEVGRFCVIADPQGAALSLITYFDQS